MPIEPHVEDLRKTYGKGAAEALNADGKRIGTGYIEKTGCDKPLGEAL